MDRFSVSFHSMQSGLINRSSKGIGLVLQRFPVRSKQENRCALQPKTRTAVDKMAKKMNPQKDMKLRGLHNAT